MTFRLKWLGTWRETYATNQHGVELRVRYLPGSGSWGVYVDGVLRHKVDEGAADKRRARAKALAKSWYGRELPSDTVPCVHCGGSGRVKRGAS